MTNKDVGELLQILGLQGQSRDEELTNVGYHQEILGGNHQEILGTLTTAVQAMKQGNAFQNALAQRLARRTPVVQDVQPTKKRRWPVGFGPTPIPPLSTVTISSKPQVLMRGEKVIDTSPFGSAGLFVQGIFVGNKPQMTTFTSSIAMSTFAAGVLDNEMMFDQKLAA